MGAEQSSFGGDLLSMLGCGGKTAERKKATPIRSFKVDKKQTVAEMETHEDMFGYGPTALHKAATCGDRLEVQRLVEKEKMLVDDKDDAGRTPFYMACKYGKLQTAIVLAKCGADPKVKDAKGKTALEVSKSKEVIAWLREFERTRATPESMQHHNWMKVQQDSMKDLNRSSSSTTLRVSPAGSRRGMAAASTGSASSLGGLSASEESSPTRKEGTAKNVLSNPANQTKGGEQPSDPDAKKNPFSMGEGINRFDMSSVPICMDVNVSRMVSIESKVAART